MASQIGQLYRCSDPKCGCEVEIVRPCPTATHKAVGVRPTHMVGSSELSTPPSEVNTPRIGAGMREGAGERRGSWGSPKFDAGSRGPFREEEGLESSSTTIESASAAAIASGSLICFCGNPMSVVGSQSSSARAGRSI